MAVKIHLNGVMNLKKPLSSDKYDLNELAIELQTEIENLNIADMGPFVLITDNLQKEINSVATIFFRFPVGGDVLLVSGNEIGEKKYITKENTKYEVTETEAGIIKSIKDTIAIYQMVMDDKEIDDSNFPKSIYYYDPDKIVEEENEEEIEFTTEFFNSAYKTIEDYKRKKSSDLKLADLILLEDHDLVVKFPPNNKKIEKIFKNMIDYFIEQEEYEKCSILEKTLKHSKDNDKLA